MIDHLLPASIYRIPW